MSAILRSFGNPHTPTRLAVRLGSAFFPQKTAKICAHRYVRSDRAMLSDAAKRNHEFEQLPAGHGIVLRAPRPEKPDCPTKRCLIVPGFDGHYRQFLKLERALVLNGIEADFLVLPGHLTDAKAPCTIDDIVATICAAHDTYGPYDSTLAHCLSANAALFSLSRRDIGQKLVFVAMPIDFIQMFRNGGKQMGLSGQALELFIREVDALCRPFDSHFDWRTIAKKRTEPLLVLHAQDDYVAPVDDLNELLDTWPNAKVALFDNGEHNGLLSQSPAIERMCAFLTQ